MNTLKPIQFILPNTILSLTEWNTQAVAEQDVTFSMEHLYLLINYILNSVFKSGFPNSVIDRDLFHKPLDLLDQNKLSIIEHYKLIIIGALSLLFAAFFIPILSFLCCCFCCTSKPKKRSQRSHYVQQYTSGSRSGSRHSYITRHKSVPKHKVESVCDCCIRPILSLILLSLLVLGFLFIICSFVTNDSVFTGVNQLPKAANSSLSDLEIYLNNTQYELDILFKTNFAQLESQLNQNLNKSGDIVKNRLAIISDAISINNLTQIVSNLQPILHDLKRLINNTNELKFLTAQLKGKINRSKQDMNEFFKACRHSICLELEEKYHQLMETFSISSRIDTIPRLSPIIDKIEYLLKQDIVTEIRKGQDKLNYVSNEIQAVVNEVLPNIRKKIVRANLALNENVDGINQLLAQPIPYIQLIQQQIGKSNSFIQKNDQYIQYVGLTCTLILFIILICYFIGLLCGLCNDQPTRYNYKNRSKKSELFFYFGIVLFFLTFTCLLSLSTISVLIGGISDRSVCFYLKNVSDPQSEQIISLIQSELQEDMFDISQHDDRIKHAFNYLKDVRLADILQRCHQNKSIIDVLQLSLDDEIRIQRNNKPIIIKLSDIIMFDEKDSIEEYLASLLNRLDINPKDIVLLTKHGQDMINVLKDTPLETLNFSSFAHIIKHSITPVDLEMISRNLEEESLKLPESEIENVARLRNIAMDLKSARDLINLISFKIENLTRNAEKIERKSHYNGKGMRETLIMLLKQAHDAQRFINQKGRTEIKSVLRNFIHDISSMISQYIQHVQYRIKYEIGRCEPVSRAFNHTVESLCDDIVLPFTACWFSIAISSLLFVPATVLVCMLNSLFRRIKRSSVRRESVLIIDNYEDDNIPLADLDKDSSRRIVPSAPVLGSFPETHSEEDTWSPGALPQHHHCRPPPYNAT